MVWISLIAIAVYDNLEFWGSSYWCIAGPLFATLSFFNYSNLEVEVWPGVFSPVDVSTEGLRLLSMSEVNGCDNIMTTYVRLSVTTIRYWADECKFSAWAIVDKFMYGLHNPLLMQSGTLCMVSIKRNLSHVEWNGHRHDPVTLSLRIALI